MGIWWVKILTAVAGGSTGAYVVSPPLCSLDFGQLAVVPYMEVGST